MSTDSKHLVILAAGTGGHVMPGLAVAKVMASRGWKISWVGTVAGMERGLVERHGIPFHALDFQGVRGRGPLGAIKGGFKLIGAFFASMKLLNELKPDAVFSTGGYVAVPFGCAAHRRKLPLVMMNCDADLLMSTNTLLPFCDALACGFAGGARTFAKEKGRTTGNPCYEDQMEGVALFAKGRSLFLFNAILNAKHQFLRMFAGDYIAAHKEACKFVDEVYGCVIPKLADMVIVSCGGYPKDINVYQMQKTMENASCAVRKDGVVILLADCEEGSGSKVLEETFRRLKTPAAIKAELEANCKIGANKAYAITRPIEKARYILVTSLDRQLAKDMLFTGAVDTVEEALEIAKQYVGETPDMILMPEGSLTVPRGE